MEAYIRSRLVDEITYKLAAASANTSTPSAILGPFWRHDAPTRQNGESICLAVPDDGQVAHISGTVTDAASGKPLKHALVDVWQASTNGNIYYEWLFRHDPLLMFIH